MSWSAYLNFLAANGISGISDDITEKEILYYFLTSAVRSGPKYIWYYDFSPTLTDMDNEYSLYAVSDVLFDGIYDTVSPCYYLVAQ